MTDPDGAHNRWGVTHKPPKRWVPPWAAPARARCAGHRYQAYERRGRSEVELTLGPECCATVLLGGACVQCRTVHRTPAIAEIRDREANSARPEPEPLFTIAESEPLIDFRVSKTARF